MTPENRSPETGSRTSLEELRELAGLRKRLQDALRDVVHTLLWFARQQRLGGMPASVWKNLDHLPSTRMHGLSPAFELVHTLQLVERAIRRYDEEKTRQLVDEMKLLRKQLDEEVNSGEASSTLDQHRQVVRLLSDDRTGTLTMESAARVLRCGSFPIRIPALPSYIAGHIIFSELRFIREQFARHGSSGTVKRAPSAAFVAQGVAAVKSFVSMIRSREICLAKS